MKVLLIGAGDGCDALHEVLREMGIDTSSMEAIGTNVLSKQRAFFTVYDVVYVFADKLSNGIDIVTMLEGLGTCRIYVITIQPRLATIYRRVGAHYVILSQPGKWKYDWLLS